MEEAADHHLLRPSLPPENGAAFAGKRLRRPNVRLGDSVPFPSHLPHPRRLKPSSKPPSKPPKPSSKPSHSTSTSHSDDGGGGGVLVPVDDNLVLAAAFRRRRHRKPRVRVPDDEASPAAAVSPTSGEEVGIGVAEWLGEMGMGRYLPVFEAHEVDGEVLPWLTMEDLRDMGIGAVGARRKLFCAIQKLQPSARR